MMEERRELDGIGRARAVAALAMIIASASIGFMVGRASAWLVPFDAPATSTLRKEAAAGTRALTPKDEPQSPPTKAASRDRAPGPTGAESEPPKPLVLPSAEPGPGSRDPRAAASPPAPGGPAPVVKAATPPAPGDPVPRQAPDPDRAMIVNPSAAESEPTKAAASDGASAGESAECERRYSSFRRSDGTYQPYGGGPRARCPFLR
jgi:BA14K-like protein